MKNAKGVIVLLIVLLAGVLLGASGAVFYYEQQIKERVSQRPPHLPTPRQKAERLGMILGLAPEQIDRAEAIIVAHEPAVEALHAAGKAAMDRILDQVSLELAPELSPEQNARLAEFVADVKSRPFPPRPGRPGDEPEERAGPGGPGGPGGREGPGRP
jgi:hypothetical protein